jgi:hypothetical protein
MTQRLTTQLPNCSGAKASQSRETLAFAPQAPIETNETELSEAEASAHCDDIKTGSSVVLPPNSGRSRNTPFARRRDLVNSSRGVGCYTLANCAQELLPAYRLLPACRTRSFGSGRADWARHQHYSCYLLVTLRPLWNVVMHVSVGIRFLRFARPIFTLILTCTIAGGTAQAADTPPFRNSDELEDGQWLTPGKDYALTRYSGLK